MKLLRAYLITLVFFVFTASLTGQEILKEEGRAAFEYLNQVREDPSEFSEEIGVDLGYVKPGSALIWNDNLMEAAEKKAADMAARGYFDHVDPDGYGMNYHIQQAGYELRADWYAKRSSNFFESISYTGGFSAEGSGVRAVKQLILDRNTNPPGHRNHLLGIVDFWKDCTDAGIGIAQTEDSIYVCFLVAKHDF